MKKTIKILLLSVIILTLLTECKTQKVIEKHYRDSVHTEKSEIKYRDTTIYIKFPAQTKIVHDTVIIYVNGKPYTSNIVTAQTDFAQAFAQIILGKLTLKIENKGTVEIYLKNAIKESVKELFNSSYTNNQSEKIVVEYRMNWFQKIFFWVGLISVLIVTLFFILRQLFKNKPLWL